MTPWLWSLSRAVLGRPFYWRFCAGCRTVRFFRVRILIFSWLDFWSSIPRGGFLALRRPFPRYL